MAEERLQKFLARAGIASRRACETLITRGLIKVNGKIVRELGTRVDPTTDRVEYDGHEVRVDPRQVYLLLHKPANCITSAHDPEGRQTVMSFIPSDYGRVFPVGRLDWDSEGAVLMTTDGDLTQLLTHPKHEVPKTYEVKVRGLIEEFDPRLDLLREGVRLDDGFTTAPAVVTRNNSTGRNTWFVVSIHEGRNRQVRRMFDAIGISVQRLRRVAYGPLILGELPPCEYRKLTEYEVEELYKAAGGRRSRESAIRGRMPDSRRDGVIAMQKSAARLTAPRRIHTPVEEPVEEPQPEERPTRRPRRGEARHEASAPPRRSVPRPDGAREPATSDRPPGRRGPSSGAPTGERPSHPRGGQREESRTRSRPSTSRPDSSRPPSRTSRPPEERSRGTRPGASPRPPAPRGRKGRG